MERKPRKVRLLTHIGVYTMLDGLQFRGGCTCGWHSERVADIGDKQATAELRAHRAANAKVVRR